MNGALKLTGLREQLAIWGIRGGFCAAPSAFWAVGCGFNQAQEVAAMGLGVVSYVVVYALMTATEWHRVRGRATAWGWAFGAAANTRSALAPLMIFGPDLWLGLATVSCVAAAAGRAPFETLAAADSFGWTYLATLLQGALVSATMLALALPWWGARVWWLGRRRLRAAARRRIHVAACGGAVNVGRRGSV